MSRCIRFSALAALIAGMTSAVWAASPYGSSGEYINSPSAAGYGNSSSSQLTLVSATEEQPQATDPSTVRLGDPRGSSTQSTGAPTAAPNAAPNAHQPAARQPAASPSASAAKPTSKTARPAQPAVRQPVQRSVVQRPDARSGRPDPRLASRGPAPTYYPQRNDVRLTADIVVDPSSPRPPEAVDRPGHPSSPEVDASVGEYPSEEPGYGDGSCCTAPGCTAPCGDPGCCCQTCCGFCAGIDYLFLRPHVSDDAAFERLTATTTVTTVTDVNRVVNFDEPYNSDYHFFVGYHNSCGDDFQVGYWHIADDGNRSGTVTGDFLAGAGTAFQAPGGTELTAAGETINATEHVTLNLYDLEDIKRVDLPALGCCCCPGWDVRWSFGLRIIDFKHTVDIFDPIETINNDAYFVGAGPKVGLDVRRQFGHSKFAAYVNAYAALLLGEGRNRSTTTTPGVLQTAVDMNIANSDEIVPDFNISFGLQWKPWCNTTITAGWMLEEFGNLGTAGAPVCTTCTTTSGQIGGGDLSYDGLFVRAEHCF